jgi:anti-sigma B factor antagonist
LVVTDLGHPVKLVIVRLPAEMDITNAQEVGERLRSAFTPDATAVIADLTSTVFCDSSGRRQLVLTRNYADAHKTQVRFAIPHDGVRRALELTGIDRLLSIYPSLDAAVSAGPGLGADGTAYI